MEKDDKSIVRENCIDIVSSSHMDIVEDFCLTRKGNKQVM